MPKLKFKSSNGKMMEVELNQDLKELTIGRNPGNNIRIANQSISRQHAKLAFDGVRCTVFDMGSSNGVFVNGKRVRSQRLYNGDNLRCGEFPLEFEDDHPDAQRPPGGLGEADVDQTITPSSRPAFAEVEFDKTIGALKETIQTLKAEQNETVAAKDFLESQVLDLKSQLETFKDRPGQDEFNALRKERDELAQTTSNLQFELDTFKKVHETLQEAHDTLKLSHDTLKADLDTLRTQLLPSQNAAQELQQLQLTHLSLQSAHQALLEQPQGPTLEAFETLQDALGEVEQERDELQTLFDALNARFDALETEHSGLQAIHQAHLGNRNATQEQVQELQDRLDQDALARAEKLQALQHELQTTREERDELAQQLQELRDDLLHSTEAQSLQLQDTQALVQALKQERDDLSRDLERLRDNAGDDDPHASARLDVLILEHEALLQELERLQSQATDDDNDAEQARLEALEQERDTLQNQLQELQTSADQEQQDQSDLHADLLQERDALLKERDALLQEKTDLLDYQNAQEQEAERLQTALAALQTAPPTPATEGGDHAEQLQLLQAHLARLQEERLEERGNLQARIETLTLRLENLQPQEDTLDASSSSQDEALHTIARLEDDLQNAEQTQDALEAKLSGLEATLLARNRELNDLRDAHTALQKHLRQLDQAQDTDNHQEDLDDLKLSLEMETNARLALLEEVVVLREELKLQGSDRRPTNDHLRRFPDLDIESGDYPALARHPGQARAPEPVQDHQGLSDRLVHQVAIQPDDLKHYIETRGSGLLLPSRLYRRLSTALNAGMHIVLTGPPGSGKTSLAHDLAAFAQDQQLSTGALHTTATPRWTQELSNPDSPTSTPLPLFLDSIRSGRWLLIDEINRGDMDKAFGALFTVLSGHPTTLSANGNTGTLRLRPPQNPDPRRWLPQDLDPLTDIVLHPNWRLIATLGARRGLFSMSPNLKRRFAFIQVNPPRPQDHLKLLGTLLQEYGLDQLEQDESDDLTAVLTGLLDPGAPFQTHDLLNLAALRSLLLYLQNALLLPEPPDPLELLAEALTITVLPATEHLTHPARELLQQQLLGHFPPGLAREDLEAFFQQPS